VDDIEVVESHIWYTFQDYAGIKIDWQVHLFHNLVMGHIPSAITVDHINWDRLDCCKINLRLANKRTQAINQKLRVDNMTGFSGVFFNKKNRSWLSLWKEADGNHCSKSLSSKNVAMPKLVPWLLNIDRG